MSAALMTPSVLGIWYLGEHIATRFVAKVRRLTASIVKVGIDIFASADRQNSWHAEADVSGVELYQEAVVAGDVQELGSPLDYVNVQEIDLRNVQPQSVTRGGQVANCFTVYSRDAPGVAYFTNFELSDSGETADVYLVEPSLGIRYRLWHCDAVPCRPFGGAFAVGHTAPFRIDVCFSTASSMNRVEYSVAEADVDVTSPNTLEVAVWEADATGATVNYIEFTQGVVAVRVIAPLTVEAFFTPLVPPSG